MPQVVAYTCQQCGQDFPAMGGGVCTSCKRTLCAAHFARPDNGVDEPDSAALVCDDCRAAGRTGR